MQLVKKTEEVVVDQPSKLTYNTEIINHIVRAVRPRLKGSTKVPEFAVLVET